MAADVENKPFKNDFPDQTQINIFQRTDQSLSC